MEIFADLHIHSRFSRACSKHITIKELEKWARIKGLNLLGTGDFTHKSWYDEIKKETEEDDTGILRTKTGFPFLWQTEISLMYSQGGKGRKVHHVILAPNSEVVDQITEELKKKGRIDYDGRPIFGISSIELMDLILSISKDIEVIPAHAWTSWMAIFGSKSGFDSIEECFKDKAKYIHAIETGMSSDPAMNWRVGSLDKINLVSFSDSHSFWPWRLGREATIFDCNLSYKEILKAIRTGEGLNSTIETPVEYGKYHWDAHRICGVLLEPKESNKLNGICPKCGKPLTIGVLNRVKELANREEGFVRNGGKPFVSLVPLHELIAQVLGIKQLSSVKVWQVYNALIKEFGNEFNILLNVDKEELNKIVPEKLCNVILKNREGKLKIVPGADGVYGQIVLDDKDKLSAQTSLGQF